MVWFLLGLHAFVGVGAVAGGMACILNPQSPLGAPVEMLQGSPFADYLIPGIILFTVVGLGNIVSAVAIGCKSRFQGCFSQVVGWGLMIWIVVQCLIIDVVHALHIIFFTLGVIQVVLSAVVMFKKRLFPANIVLDTYKRFRSETV